MPRAVDTAIPPIDKDPTRFGTDYTNPLGAISDAASVAGDQIRDGILIWIRDVIGIDLTGPAQFIQWLSDQIGVALTDLADLLLNIAAPVIDAVEDILELIFKLTGIDLRSADGFLNWIAGLIGYDLRDLATALANFVGQTIDDILDGIKNLLGLDLRDLANLNPVKLLTDIVASIGKLLDGIFGIFGGVAGVGKTVDEALAAITGWFTNIFAPLLSGFTTFVEGIYKLFSGAASGAGRTVAETITAISTWFTNVFAPLLQNFTKLVEGLFSLFSGGVNGAGQTVTTMLTAISTWFTNIFTPLLNGFQSLIDGIYAMFSGIAGTTGHTAAQAINAINTWLTNTFTILSNNVKSLVEGLWSIFSGGASGVGKNVTQMITAINTWLTTGPFKILWDLVQGLLDALAKLKPGNIAAGVSAGLQDALNTISWILGIGQAAQASAANAELGVAGILAEQAGGYKDEFTYPVANRPPANLWTEVRVQGVNGYGPDGQGKMVWKEGAGFHANTDVFYRQITKPLLKADGRVTTILTKAPYWDIFNVSSAFWLCAQWQLNDPSRIQVQIGHNYFRFQTVNSAGVVTPLGTGNIAISPNVAVNDQFDFVFTGTGTTGGLQLLRNGVALNATPQAYTILTGRYVGFGGGYAAHTNSGAAAAPEFAGLTWQ